MRIETKYLISQKEFLFLKSYLSSLYPCDSFSDPEVGYEVKSLYFDTIQKDSYFEKEDGDFNKKKWRLRTYNNINENTFFEVKSKKGKVVKKEKYKWAEFEGRQLIPMLISKYKRIAFESGSIRVTLDYDLQFSKANHVDEFLEDQEMLNEEAMILEIKLATSNNVMELDWVTNLLKLPVQSFSKYEYGMRLVYDL